MPDPINYLAGMQNPDIGNFISSLQTGIQAGLQTPTALEQQKQQEDINASRLNQSVIQQKADEQRALIAQQKKASDYYMQVLQNPNATPDEIQRAEDGVSYFNPEFGKMKEVVRKNQSALVNGFGKESSFGLYNAIRSQNPDLINAEFDRYQTAADSRPELKFQADVIRNLRRTYEQNPNLALAMIRNAAFSSDPTEFKKVWEAEGEQQKVEGVGATELPLKEKNQFIEDQRKTWEKAFAPYNIRQEYNSIIKQAANDKIGDIARIKAFVKMITPNESVMEADVKSVSGMGDTVRGFLENIQRKFETTGLLDEKDRNAIERESQALFERSKKKVDFTQKSMTPLLRKNNVDPADVFIFDMGENTPKPNKEEKPKPNLTPYNPSTLPSRESAMRVNAAPSKGGNLKSYQDAAKRRLDNAELDLPAGEQPAITDIVLIPLVSPSGVKFSRTK